MTSRFVLLNLAVIAVILQLFAESINTWSSVPAKYVFFGWVLATVTSIFVWLAILVHHAINYYSAIPTIRNIWILVILAGSLVSLIGPLAYYLYVLEFRSRTTPRWQGR